MAWYGFTYLSRSGIWWYNSVMKFFRDKGGDCCFGYCSTMSPEPLKKGNRMMCVLKNTMLGAMLFACATMTAEAGSCLVSGDTARVPAATVSSSGVPVVLDFCRADAASVVSEGDFAMDARFFFRYETMPFWIRLTFPGLEIKVR